MNNTVNLGGYKISFIGTMANIDSETWIYKLTKEDTPDPPISNWGIELCSDPLHKVISATGPTIAGLGTDRPLLPFEGNGVIWGNLNNDNVDGIYTFTLKGKHQKALKKVVLHTGEFCHTAFITGPSCEGKTANDKEKEAKKEQIITKQEQPQKLPENKSLVRRGIKIFY
ncbi:MAG: hypothetical protein GXW85_07010 [Clostridia bacterium]|nr:hypothetical protein [Clostridia bacterium]